MPLEKQLIDPRQCDIFTLRNVTNLGKEMLQLICLYKVTMLFSRCVNVLGFSRIQFLICFYDVQIVVVNFLLLPLCQGAWVLEPRHMKPTSIVHFIGGIFVGAAPQLTYRLFLERLCEKWDAFLFKFRLSSLIYTSVIKLDGIILTVVNLIYSLEYSLWRT